MRTAKAGEDPGRKVRPAPMQDEQLAMALGQRFATKLREAIGAKNFRAMQKRNAKETSQGICHSHDFCDANMVMLEAMQELRPDLAALDCNTEAFCAPFNAAWEWALRVHLGGKASA